MGRKGIFIAATGQNVGKTTLCLGLIAMLKKNFPRLGFIKPVGQQQERVGNSLLVDKDVVLFKEYFGLQSGYQDMSPVIFPKGFTRDFLDGKISETDLVQTIRTAFSKIADVSDFTIVEGTGHAGVGSIVNLSNAKVAKMLKLDLIIIAEAGLGKAFDELALSKALCDLEGVKIAGIILNRAVEDKREMIETYMKKALKRWNIPLIGIIPYSPFLNAPTMEDFELLFDTKLLSGEEFHYRHFEQMRLVAGSPEIEMLLPDELIVTPADRDDIITSLIEKESGGIILTGRFPPTTHLIEKLKIANIPSLYVPLTNTEAMKMIAYYKAKIRKGDFLKVEKAISLVEEYLDIDPIRN